MTARSHSGLFKGGLGRSRHRSSPVRPTPILPVHALFRDARKCHEGVLENAEIFVDYVVGAEEAQEGVPSGDGESTSDAPMVLDRGRNEVHKKGKKRKRDNDGENGEGATRTHKERRIAEDALEDCIDPRGSSVDKQAHFGNQLIAIEEEASEREEKKKKKLKKLKMKRINNYTTRTPLRQFKKSRDTGRMVMRPTAPIFQHTGDSFGMALLSQ